MRIVVTGSLAYDYLMTVPGRFREHFLSDRMHRLTVSFLVDDMKRLRGGVAGNIAWTLALLGGKPLLIATAGEDFAEYRAALDRAEVDTSGVTVIPGEFTASCFINTDLDANQIVAFYAGALSHG
ncbi:MAG TPA: PfkB family carbohydrate kinase, partial [Myxococcaceae bacterium]